MTGGGRGIGRVYCEHLAGLGHRIVVADIDGANASAVSKLVTEGGGSAIGLEVDVSEQSSVDDMVRAILDKAYARTRGILTENLDKLHAMAKALLLYETIDAPQITAIMEGRDPPPPAGWGKTGGDKPGSDKPEASPPLPPIGGAAEQT